MFRCYFALCLLLLVSACKKENKHPQWDIEVYGPLLHATLGMNELVGSSSIEADSNGAQILDFDTLLSAFKIDSIYRIADTSITTIEIFPVGTSTIFPGTAFVSNNKDLTLGLGNIQLKEAIISSGKIRLEIKNTLNSKINFIYTIPLALKNGLPFTANAFVDSASATNPKFFTGEFDFSGYTVDLRGSAGNLVNSLTYNVKAISSIPGFPFNISGGDELINLKTTLVSIQPLFVRGYLGQSNTHAVTTENIGIGGLIKNGSILLDSVQMNLDIINYIGADAQANVSSLRSINNRTGNTVNLTAPSFINHYLNINRAGINSTLADSLQPTFYAIQLDQSNSNIKSIIENLPDKFDYDLSLNLNPLGNNSGSNDFVFSDKLLDTRLRIKMPLRFALNQLLLADTVPFSINNATDFDAVGPLTLTVLADNGFPFDMNIQLFLLDNSQSIVDSLFVPDLIAAAPYDAAYRATGIKRTEIKIPVDAIRKQRLLSVERVAVRMKFNTPDYPQKIQFYTNYKLDLKMVADGVYSIR